MKLQSKMTKEIISHDKNLREKIEFLELEKSHLDDKIFREKELIEEAFSKDLERLIKKTQKENVTALKAKEKHEKEAFDKRLKTIKDIYNKQKDAWVESIFNACIESGGQDE